MAEGGDGRYISKNGDANEEAMRVAFLLRKQEMYTELTHENLMKLARLCEREEFEHGQNLVKQGTKTSKAYFLAEGKVARVRVNPVTLQEKVVDQKSIGTSINSLHHLRRDDVFASARCDSPKCVAYSLDADRLEKLISSDSVLMKEVIFSLQKEVRRQSKELRAYNTPILETKQRFVNIPACMIAAGIESYYRSALNAFINMSLTGQKGRLFPNMGVQVPSRIAYILGFKTLRSFTDNHIHPDNYSNPTLVRLGAVLMPGLIMCPISSMLEATNAGHLNPEPLVKRWTRGYLPRMCREVVFGVGLNQLSDVMEERVKNLHVTNQSIANALGSLSAGVIAGYLSHVPHNLSTLKLMQPQLSYTILFNQFVQKSIPTYLQNVIAKNVPIAIAPAVSSILAVLFPRGCLIRTSQIVGTFIILNSTINFMTHRESQKIDTAVKEMWRRKQSSFPPTAQISAQKKSEERYEEPPNETI